MMKTLTSVASIMLGAALAACMIAMPIACVHCPAGVDAATCDVQNAIAIAGTVDEITQTLLATGVIPLPFAAAIAAYHLALPSAIQAADTALATYELNKTDASWKLAIKVLESLWKAVDGAGTANGQPSVLTQAQTQVKSQGAAATISRLKMKGVLK